MKVNFICILIFCFIALCTGAVFSDYINSIGSYFGFHNENNDDSVEIYNQKIPYEVSTTDERFLNEAAKLTGVALTELDSCQQRVTITQFTYTNSLHYTALIQK